MSNVVVLDLNTPRPTIDQGLGVYLQIKQLFGRLHSAKGTIEYLYMV